MKAIIMAEMKCKIIYSLLIVTLLYSFLIRINHLGHTYRLTDSYRDYLVGRNIVRENKLNLIGPYNGGFSTLSSPIYFYLIAGVLKINQSILFLELILILVQIISIYTLFLIGKNLLSGEVGLVAAIIYSFSGLVLQQTSFIWQAYLMQPIFIFALYFLARSYKNRSFKSCLISIVLLSLATIINNQVLGMIIPLGISFFVVFRKNKWVRSKILLSILLTISLFLISYFPPLLYHLSEHQSIIQEATNNLDPGSFFQRLPQNFTYLIHLNAYHLGGAKEKGLVYEDWLTNILALILIELGILTLYDPKIKSSSKLVLLLLILFTVSPPVIASFSKQFIRARHFLPSLIPLSLLMGQVISTKLNNYLPQVLLKILVIFLLVKGLMFNPEDFNLQSQPEHPTGQLSQETFNLLRQDIIKTKNDYQLADFNFFQFNIYPNTPELNGWSDAEFWVKLEDSFGTKFTKNDDSHLFLAYTPTNSNQFVYLICDTRIIKGLIDECLNVYLNSNNYQMIRQVARENYRTIFLTRRRSL